MDIKITIVGMPELIKKLNYNNTVAPAVLEDITANVQKRWMRKRTKTRLGTPAKGALANTLSATSSTLAATSGIALTVASTLSEPRTTGVAWQRSLIGAARAALPNFVRAAANRIERTWGA